MQRSTVTRVASFLLAMCAAASLFHPAARAADDKDDKKDDSKKLDEKSLQGTWKPNSTRQDGNDEPADEAKRYVVKFEDGGKYLITRDGDKFLKGTYKLDAEKKPAQLDLTVEENADNANGAGETLQGIVELKGEELTWCFSPPNEGSRPNDFTAESGSRRILVKMKKDK